MTTSLTGFYFKVSGTDQFCKCLSWTKCKFSGWGRGQSRCSSSLEICTDMGQPCKTSVLWLFLYSQLSIAAPHKPSLPALSLPFLASEMLEDVYTNLVVELPLPLTHFLLCYDKLQNHPPSHSADMK